MIYRYHLAKVYWVVGIGNFRLFPEKYYLKKKGATLRRVSSGHECRWELIAATSLTAGFHLQDQCQCPVWMHFFTPFKEIKKISLWFILNIAVFFT